MTLPTPGCFHSERDFISVARPALLIRTPSGISLVRQSLVNRLITNSNSGSTGAFSLLACFQSGFEQFFYRGHPNAVNNEHICIYTILHNR
jgi:hypothetical protein